MPIIPTSHAARAWTTTVPPALPACAGTVSVNLIVRGFERRVSTRGAA